MTADNITKVPALGQAWSGDWQARILVRLRVRGFKSVTAFAEANPVVSLKAMAEELSTDHQAGVNHADVAAEQLVRIWREEASQGGANAVERFSRRMLVGELHRDLPDGWRSEWNSEAARPAMSRMTAAMTNWTCNHSSEYKAASDRVLDAMIDEGRSGRIPFGWLPVNADDPVLIDIFKRHWPEPK
jgi:hypothetical protein